MSDFSINNFFVQLTPDWPMKRLLQIYLLLLVIIYGMPSAKAQSQSCDEQWRKCELETVYCQRDVEDLGERTIVSISRKIEEYYRDQPATFNACIQYERCIEWKDETCWLSKQLKKRRDDF